MDQEAVGRWVQNLIDDNRLHDFYISTWWLQLRAEVLAEHKHECQQCKERGFYTRADTVHHVRFVRKYPQLALSKFYTFEGETHKNLLPLCHACHEEVHGNRRVKAKPLTEERW